MNAVVQVVGFGAGVVVVRALDKSDYSLYTIVISSGTAGAVIIGSGIGSALMSIGGSALHAGKGFGEAIAAARWARRVMLAWTIVPVLGLLIWLLLAAGATVVELTIAAVCISMNLYASTVTESALITLRLFQDVRSIQLVALMLNSIRLAVFTAMWLVGVSWMPGFLLAMTASALLEAWLRERRARHWMPWPKTHPAGAEAPFRRAIRQSVLPSVAQASVGQAVPAALTSVGNVVGVGEVGALSRFNMLFQPVNEVVRNLATPAIARLSHSRRDVFRVTWLLVLLYSVLGLAFVLVCWLASDLLLWFLGPEYAGLNLELVIIAIGAAVGNLSQNAVGAVNYARSWQRLSWVYVPCVLVWLILCLSFLDLRTSLGAVLLSASSQLAFLAVQIVRWIVGFRSMTGSGKEPA